MSAKDGEGGDCHEFGVLPMSNASLCLETAARYARLAAGAGDAENRVIFRRLEALWREMASLADLYDRANDPTAKGRIFELVDATAEVRRKVA